MDVGYVLSSAFPVVENIFKYLNKQELDCCSEVCELWKTVAETEKNRREDIAWFFQGLKCPQHDKIHTNYVQECNVDISLDIEDDLSRQLKEQKIKPNFCITFATIDFINHFESCFPSFHYSSASQSKRIKREDLVQKRAYLKAGMQTALLQYLPEKCKTSFFVARGLIGCDTDYLPCEIEEGLGISGFLIPYVPGLQIFNFPIDEKQGDITKSIPKDMDIKCLLVFITRCESSYFNKIIQSCLLKQNSRIAIGGAVIERSESGCGSVVAFCGRSVEAASIIIKRSDGEAELEKKLKLFEETGLLKYRCFAFMFACVARGYYIYRKFNVESSVFHNLYPKVPLIGIFGNGEIGVDYLPNIMTENQNRVLRIGKLARCRKRYLHSYTTIFVLVSVKC